MCFAIKKEFDNSDGYHRIRDRYIYYEYYCRYNPKHVKVEENNFCSKFEKKDTSEEVEFDRLFNKED